MVAESGVSPRPDDDRRCERGSLGSASENGRWLEDRLEKSVPYEDGCKSEKGRVTIVAMITV